MDIPVVGVAAFVRRLADDAGIASSRDFYSDIADAFSELSDKEVESDQTQDLIIMLSRRGVISSEDAWLIYQAYLNDSVAEAVSEAADEYHCRVATEADREHSAIITALRTRKG